MKKVLLMPIHIYPWDPHSQLFALDKVKLYEFSINEQYKALRGEADLYVIGHGETQDIKTPPEVTVIWSDFFQLPTKSGLFEGFPAQWNIVLEGAKYLKKLGYTHLIKSRGDSIIQRPQVMLNDTNFRNKVIFTQQTTYREPFELGDCFMSGPIDKIISLWTPNTLKLPENGFEFMANQFINISGKDRHNFINVLITTSGFYDLSTLCVIDCRFNWRESHKDLTSGAYIKNYDKFLWGAKNNWLKYHKRRIIDSDRNFLVTESYLEEKLSLSKKV